MNEKIWLSLAHLSGNEMKYIQEAFDTNWVTSAGKNIDEFEKQLESFLSDDAGNETNVFVTALSSGTAALHLGLLLLGVGPGDEVLCQSFTYAASANPIYYVGATPVFVDSEPDTWNMSPEHLRRAIIDRIAKGKKPKAIIPVDQYGMPVKMDEINAIAQEYEIPVLEDAAEALGSTYKKKACGSLGDMGVLSFNGNKIITTSGGGALVSRNKQLVKNALHLSTQARDVAPHYQHSHIGYNYRMSNIIAGIGRGQMEVLEKRIEQRRANNIYYRQYLSNVPGLTFHSELSSDFFSNFWLTAILINPEKSAGITREDIRLHLESCNIEARPVWKPMHQQPVFADCPYYGEGISDRLFEQGLCLPSSSILKENDLQRVVKGILDLYK
ncbi:aminotransferase class I/II-fold pyridoxal phosphate-dependent enzyme [Bacteroidales bacterium OttesenSCG-928-M11]|nr:aminotransferase class I/II-fold pyridoxal phosphate-dependent enzyme [Bacteroidales bacterium OttesenSCG-928-M11]